MINADRLRAVLPDVLAPVLGDAVTIENPRALTGGAGRVTWALQARTRSAARPLILRTGHPDELHAGMELAARVQAAAGGRSTSSTCADCRRLGEGAGHPLPDLRRGRR